MKFSKLSQLFLVSSIGLLVATLLTACQIVTIDYLFVANSSGSGTGSAGQIQTYAVDSQSGAIRSGAASISSGGTVPVAMAVTSDFANLYVANQGNNSVVHFAIASNGVLTSKDTITMSVTPVSLAVNAANTYLYVVSGTTSATLTEYPIGTAVTSESLILPGYTTDTIIPTGVTVLANNDAVYVTAYDQSVYNPGGSTNANDNANPGWVFGYSVGSGGALSATTNSPYQAGVKPTALAADPTNRFVYVTDWASNEMIGYSITSGNVLNFLVNGPFKTGSEPAAITLDPRGKFIYVANSSSATVSAYSIDLTTGTPTATVSATSGSANSTDTWPVAVVVDPALGRYVYTANQLGNTVSGFILDPTAGTLNTTPQTPYPTGANPSAVVCVPHGNHALPAVE
jgi:6-phosphogluconolactonase (cycloisomerase 2 family)